MKQWGVPVLKKRKKIDNRGAALISVIVITAFLTIVATIVLYITARNYITKQVDYNNTYSFYKAEEALDTIKALLVHDVNEAYMYAYTDAMSNYVKHTKDADINNYYANSYLNKLNSYWVDRGINNSSKTYTDVIKEYMNKNKVNPDIIDCITEVGAIGISTDGKKFIIQGVEAQYYDKDSGYSTYLQADIVLEVPDVFNNDTTDTNPINVADCVKYANWQKYD